MRDAIVYDIAISPPQLMNFQGHSLLIDPDIFAVGDVWELLSRSEPFYPHFRSGF